MKNQLAITVLRKQSPLIPISFLDMIKIIASEVQGTWDNYQRRKIDLQSETKVQPGNLLSEELRQGFEDVMDDMIELAKTFGFNEVGDAATRVREQVDTGMIRGAPRTVEVVYDLILDLDNSLHRAISKKKLIFVPTDKETFFNAVFFCHPQFNKLVPEAARDILEAGNCLAFDLNTAAAFHLMRIMEHGTRALAYALNAKLAKGVEGSDWGQLTQAIEAAIKRRREKFDKSKRKKLAESDMLKELGVIAHELHVFRVIDRNRISHTGKPYESPEAVVLYRNVQDFTRRLSKVLKNLKNRRT